MKLGYVLLATAALLVVLPQTFAQGGKPGVCPEPGFGVCVEECESDAGCPGSQKCCFNGCGHTCTDPEVAKPGMCPKPTGAGICVELCSSDADCDGAQKCCFNGCGHTCQDPVE